MRTATQSPLQTSGEPALYPPLAEDLKNRMRLAGWGDLVPVLDGVKEETVKGLLVASQSGPIFGFVRSGYEGQQKLL